MTNLTNWFWAIFGVSSLLISLTLFIKWFFIPFIQRNFCYSPSIKDYKKLNLEGANK